MENRLIANVVYMFNQQTRHFGSAIASLWQPVERLFDDKVA